MIQTRIGENRISSNIDWLLILFMLPVLGAGLVTMKSFTGETSFFSHQLMWIGISFLFLFSFSFIDFRFLKRTDVLVTIFLIFSGLLLMLFFFGHTAKGAQSWFSF